MRNYRDNWFNVGAVLAMAIAGALALSHRRLSRPRLFSALNLAALMVHQFEEYGFPGYFPGMLNAGVFKSDKPERYPLNTNSALIVNAVVGYPFYLLPVLFPKRRSFGLAPVLLGFAQALFHGIVPPLRAKTPYGPGFLSAFFLHVPIGAKYIREAASERPLGRGEWVRAALYMVAFAALGIGAPLQLLRNEESPYRFTERQVGPYGKDG
jgi:Protein of unknown function with HXXEE motif